MLALILVIATANTKLSHSLGTMLTILDLFNVEYSIVKVKRSLTAPDRT